MSGIEQVMFAIGVFASIVGAIAFTGLLAWQGLEWWIKFNYIRTPLMDFYWQKLREKKDRQP